MAKTPDRSTKGTGFRRQAEELLRTTKRDGRRPCRPRTCNGSCTSCRCIRLSWKCRTTSSAGPRWSSKRPATAIWISTILPRPAHLTLDTHGTIVEANLRAGTLLGINRNELIGQSLARFITPSDQATFHRHCQEVLKTGVRQTCEVHLRTKGRRLLLRLSREPRTAQYAGLHHPLAGGPSGPHRTQASRGRTPRQ